MSVESKIPEDVLRAALNAVKPGDVLLVSEVGWDLKHPCADCPFLKSSPYHSGVAASVPEYADSIMAHRFAHTCHKTDARPACDGPRTWEGQPQHCAGATIMLLKTGKGMDLQLPLLQAVEAGKLDIRDMTARAKADRTVFTVPGLLKFYATKMARRLRKIKQNGPRKKRKR